MKVSSDNMFGLHKRQTYEELVGEIGKPPIKCISGQKGNEFKV